MNDLVIGRTDTTTPDASSAISSEQEDSVLEINQARFTSNSRTTSKEHSGSIKPVVQNHEPESVDKYIIIPIYMQIRPTNRLSRSRKSTVSKIGKRILHTLN